MARYIVEADIRPLDSGGYSASCTNLDGCEASAETFGQTIGHLVDAAEAVLKLRRERGLDLPPRYTGRDKVIVRTQMLIDAENVG